MKRRYTAVLLSLALFCALLSGCGVSAYTYENANRYSTGAAALDGGIRNIDVEWIAGQVELVTHRDDTVAFSESADGSLSDAQQMRYLVAGDTLYIRFMKSGTRLRRVPEKTLTLALPETLELNDLEIETASASVTAEGLAARSAEIDTASGGVSLTRASVSGALQVDTASGGVQARLEGGCGEIEIETASGAVELYASGGNMEIETASGDVDVYLPADTGFTAYFDTASGDFNSDFPVNVSGSRYSCGGGATIIAVDTASGNLGVWKQ